MHLRLSRNWFVLIHSNMRISSENLQFSYTFPKRQQCYLLDNDNMKQTIHCVSKNETDVVHYNFNTHQLILVIFWQRCC